MSTIAPPRPDLESHARAMRAPFSVVVDELRTILGARLVAYISSVSETRAVHEWAEKEREPKNRSIEERLRLALQIALSINNADGAEVAQAWFQGLNPQLDDHSPARLLREGDLHEVGPAVIAAERAFLVGG